jgi:hypothetical protein
MPQYKIGMYYKAAKYDLTKAFQYRVKICKDLMTYSIMKFHCTTFKD